MMIIQLIVEQILKEKMKSRVKCAADKNKKAEDLIYIVS